MTVPVPPDAVWLSACATDREICVELTALTDGTFAIRDSKLGANSPVLGFTADELRAFAAAIDDLLGAATSLP